MLAQCEVNEYIEDVNGEPGPRTRTFWQLWVYEDRGTWEEDVKALYEEQPHRMDFVALPVGGAVQPRLNISLDYAEPETEPPSRLRMLHGDSGE